MQYNGGKAAVGKKWAAMIGTCDTYWEPFCGMLGVGSHVRARRRFFSDADRSVIAFLRALQAGWTPPSSLTEDEYHRVRQRGDEENPLYAFAAFGCSFAGKKWGGYARSGERNYALNAYRAAIRLASLILSSDTFLFGDYRVQNLEVSTIYCDPPYSRTTRVGPTAFDEAVFEEWIRTLRHGVDLFVSEYRDLTHLGMLARSTEEIKDGLRRKSGAPSREVLWSRLAA